MVTVIYTTIVLWSFIDWWLRSFSYWRSCCDTRCIPLIVIIPLIVSICVVCKYICVVSRELVCCFFVREHSVASFFSSGFAIGGLWSFPCFASFLFILLLMLSLSLVSTKCFGCDAVSGGVLVWICDWFVKILVDVLKLSWYFSDFRFDISFNGRVWSSISWRRCYCPPVICPLVIYCFYCWYYFFIDGNLVAIYFILCSVISDEFGITLPWVIKLLSSQCTDSPFHNLHCLCKLNKRFP